MFFVTRFRMAYRVALKFFLYCILTEVLNGTIK